MLRIIIAILAVTVAVAVAPSCSGRVAQPSETTAPKPHAVLLVLDEFPGDSLLDERGQIDAVRYPNFAALASDSVWFRNGYSSYDATTKAVPLILDGMRPRPGTAATRGEHPHSVFDMFNREGYRIVSSEEGSALCPPSMCRGGRAVAPAIIPNLFSGRPQRFKRWVRSIHAARRPTFWMKHALLPHGPYLYLPSGAQTRPRPRDLLPGMNTTPGFHDEFLTRHNEQRYLLQLGYADRLLGRLMRRLRVQEIYDDTLIVVIADHGFAWESGVADAPQRECLERRGADSDSVLRQAPGPGARGGERRIRAHPRRRLDDGRRARLRARLPRRRHLGLRRAGETAAAGLAHGARLLLGASASPAGAGRGSAARWCGRRLHDFGSGDLATLFAGIGPNRSLVGRATDSLTRAAGGSAARSAIAQDQLFADVRRASGVVPAQIVGNLRGGRAGAKRDLAVAVNGRVEAVGRSFYLAGDATEHFAFNVPEAALREGRNKVEVFEVVAGERLLLLARS